MASLKRVVGILACIILNLYIHKHMNAIIRPEVKTHKFNYSNIISNVRTFSEH